MTYLYFKSLHIIFITTWFAALFYIVRLFIYHKEADRHTYATREVLQKQYRIMAKRLWYIIGWPSAILAVFFAITLLYLHPSWLTQGWMQIKLLFVLLLFVYHGYIHFLYKQMSEKQIKMSSTALRIYNETATIILFACVFLVVLKNTIGWLFGVVGILGLSIILMIGIKVYKKIKGL